MQTDIRERAAGSFVLSLRGELDHHASGEVIARLRECTGRIPFRELELDLGGVTFSDSSGIAVAVLARRLTAGAGGSLSIKNTPPQMQRLFRTAGLGRMLGETTMQEGRRK
ncbi:MAG: STAS domain-containing protein [Clostridia bacterium]|nr:STAS domain-containing protein [Clostridia bacterium]